MTIFITVYRDFCNREADSAIMSCVDGIPNSEHKPLIKKPFILKDVFGSDHCPVGIEIHM